MSFVSEYLAETIAIAEGIDREAIESLVGLLEDVHAEGGRLFILGLGGSATNASHAAADFRMRAGLRAEAPDSLAEITALINDTEWETAFIHWLELRHLEALDAVLMLSVGGGDWITGTSLPLVRALHHAKSRHIRTAAIVGEPGGACRDCADVLVQIPVVAPARKTEHCEAWQAVIWHLVCAQLAAR